MYKMIVLILLVALFSTGCKQKTLEAKFLTDVAVIRQTTASGQAEKKADVGEPENLAGKSADSGEDRSASSSGRGSYCIIVASYPYAKKATAEKLVKDLQELGYPAELLKSMDRFRVSIERFRTEKEAMIQRDKLRKTTDREDIWVLKLD